MLTFSPRIQSLIDSSGKENAIKRAVEIRQHVQALETQINPPKVETSVEAKFAQVLKDSSAENVKFRMTNEARFESLKKLPQIGELTSLNKANEIKKSDKTNLFADKAQLKEMITKTAEKYGVDAKLVQAVVKQESAFNPKATSHCGAMGLMQLMPATAKGLGVKDAYNPVQNVDGGVRYLKSMLDKYNGNVILALAAYNAGPGAVDKYDDVPPYKETQNYVKNILANYLN